MNEQDASGDLVDFITFKISTGEILQLMRGSHIGFIDAQCDPAIDPDVGWVFGHWSRDDYIIINGEAKLKETTNSP